MAYAKSLFQGVPKKNTNYSRFNMSHEYKDDLIPGRLIPIYMEECMPGDYWNIRPELFFKCDPLYYPIIQKMTFRFDLFWIPYRILWVPEQGAPTEGWTKFITGQNEELPPTCNPDMNKNLTLFDDEFGNYPNQVLSFLGRYGLPLIDGETDVTNPIIDDVSAFPLSAYLKIWDEYYRNPQLEEEKWFPLNEGDANNAAFDLAFENGLFPGYWGCLPAKWEMDYLTSAIPTPQVGDAILIPSVEDGFPKEATAWKNISDGTPASGPQGLGVDSAGETVGLADGELYHEHNATIKQLRLAEVLQSFYERMMKIGQRYRDYIEGMFGDDPQPGTVDVPVAIGSMFGQFQVADVMQQATTEIGSIKHRTGDYTGQINMYKNGAENFEYKCLEHGIIMGIIQINANTGYGQGIQRFWRRQFITDFPLDMFANIGDQEILKEEVVYNPTIGSGIPEKNLETFGYIPRFSEMRYANNKFGGRLLYSIGVSKHLGRIWFGGSGAMNSTEYDNLIEINRQFVWSAATDDGGHRLTDVWRALPSEAEQTPTQGVITAYIHYDAWVNRQLPMFSTPDLT